MGESEVRRIRVTSPIAAARTIRAERLDVLVDFGPWPRVDALISALSGARCTIGFETPRQFRHFCYDIALKHSGEVHELMNYRALVGALGVSSTHEPQIVIDGNPPLIRSSPYVVFHMWPGGYLSQLREWPEDRWRSLAELALAAGFAIVLTGTKGDQAGNEALIRKAPAGVVIRNVAGELNLTNTARVLARSAAVVSVNTGIMHLAAAAGIPTVGLSGPTSVTRWGAVGRNVCNVAPDAAGCGFLNLGFEYRRHRTDCMAHISVASVWEALQQVIRGAAAVKRRG